MAQLQNTDPTNPLLDEITQNLDCFIENINCLRETYGYSEGSLKQQSINANKAYDEFVKPFQIVGNDIDGVSIPSERLREFKKIERHKQRATRAQSLIPPSFIVTLVSLFDSFYAGLIRCVYNICPDKLKECNKELQFKDISEYNTVSEIRKYLIDCIIEDQLRKSHKEQFDWLEKTLDLKTLKDFERWPDFIELTERRNLFVHSDGIISSQYLKICTEHKVPVKSLQLGGKLDADRDYFNRSYKLVYEIGIMLTQILINKLYIGVAKGKDEERDKVLINNVYELIMEKHYDIAISVSRFVMDNKCFRRNNKDRIYIVLNLAQSYKWIGDNDSCQKVLRNEDTSSWAKDFLVPKLCLEEKFEEAYQHIEQVGKTSEVLTTNAYREWPIFNALREREDFPELFNRIFGEELILTQNINITTVVKSTDDTSTTSG